VYAPPDVLEAVLRAALGHGRSARARLHAYALGDDFSETTQALEIVTEPPAGGLRGAHYDLEQVFERVNAGYFGSQVARPRLTWSAAVARRRLGYYQPSADRLVISRALDAPGVPACAIELVMYHELLHKHLGVQVVNGRQAAHTEQFRQAERRFHDFEAAQAFIKKL
jgi:SprT-like family protein